MKNLRGISWNKEWMRPVDHPKTNDDADPSGDSVVIPEEARIAPRAPFISRISKDQIASRGKVLVVATRTECAQV